MTVRAKMQCTEVAENRDYPDQKYVTLQAVYSSDPNDPNYSWSKLTPSGKIELTITNPEAFSEFQVSCIYHVDFNRVK